MTAAAAADHPDMGVLLSYRVYLAFPSIFPQRVSFYLPPTVPCAVHCVFPGVASNATSATRQGNVVVSACTTLYWLELPSSTRHANEAQNDSLVRCG